MYLIDSSVLIAYFRRQENNHSKAQEIIDKLGEMIITDYILLEVTTVLLLRESKEIAQRASETLTNNKDIKIIRLTEEELKETIDRFQKQKSTLSFVDISILVLKEGRKLEIHTFDKELIAGTQRPNQ